MPVSHSKLAWLTPNLRILWISACSFWLCASIHANPIIYRLVPSPSRFETRQLTARSPLSQPNRVCVRDVIILSSATKDIILIRHNRYQIYTCLQLSSSIASFVWKLSHFEFRSYGGAWHNAKIASVEQYVSRELNPQTFLSHGRQPEVETSPLLRVSVPFRRKCQVVNSKIRAL